MSDQKARSLNPALRPRVLAAGVVIFSAIFLVGLLGPWKAWVSDFGLLAGAAIGAVACIFAAIKTAGRLRRGWTFIAGAMISWALGEAIWFVYEVVLNIETPFPSIADIAYLAAIPLAAVGVLSFPSGVSTSSRVRMLFDGLILVTALFCVSWATTLRPIYQATTEGLLGRTITLAYPAGDLVILVTVLFVAARAGRGGRLTFGLLGGGLAALSLADTAYALLTASGNYASGNILDAAWFAGYLMIGAAALRHGFVPSEATRGIRLPSRLSISVPYLAVMLAITVGSYEQITIGRMGPVLFWNIVTLVLLVSIRQLIALFDNVVLTRGLEEKVRERTFELESAMRELERAKQLQEEFVANTSHELRTPLTTLIGTTRTLMRPDFQLDTPALELVKMADSSATRMSKLVEDLLIASSMSDSLNVELQEVDLRDLVDQTGGEFKNDGNRVDVLIPSGFEVVTDPEKLQVILEQLLSNAHKFSPEGSTITIEAESNGHGFDLFVSDEGPGIPAESSEKVFDQFVQLDGGATRTNGGVGLGLFIARRLAEGMGATIAVEREGRTNGTTMRVSSGEVYQGSA